MAKMVSKRDKITHAERIQQFPSVEGVEGSSREAKRELAGQHTSGIRIVRPPFVQHVVLAFQICASRCKMGAYSAQGSCL